MAKLSRVERIAELFSSWEIVSSGFGAMLKVIFLLAFLSSV